jgi:hypothetical protein
MNQAASGGQQRPVERAMLLIPPLALVIGALTLLGASLLSWGAASEIGARDWMPPAAGLIVAVGGLLLGGYELREVLKRTQGDFNLFPLQLVAGSLLLVLGAGMQIAIAIEIGDPGTYEHLKEPDGSIRTSPTLYFIGSTLLSLFTLFYIWTAAYVYGMAITNQKPNRISERKPGEVDAIGELIRERKAD